MLDPLPKTAYTHGLELIYTLQDVDITSVRVLNPTNTASAPPKSSLVPFPLPLNREIQLEFALGYDEQIPLFSDPEVLVDKIDSDSLIKALIKPLDRKKAYILLEKYQLKEFVSLIPTETLEIRKSPMAKKMGLLKESFEILRAKENLLRVKKLLEPVFDVFIKPWIRRRLGLASKQELEERWQKLSQQTEIGELVLAFLKDLFEPTDFYALFLQKADENLYADQLIVLNSYQSVISTAKSYLRTSPFYHLSQLVALISRELAQQWKDFPEGFIEKALFLCREFSSRKDRSNQIVISLNPEFFLTNCF